MCEWLSGSSSTTKTVDFALECVYTVNTLRDTRGKQMTKHNKMSGESFESLLFNLRDELSYFEDRYRRNNGVVADNIARQLETTLQKYNRIAHDLRVGRVSAADEYDIEEVIEISQLGEG